LGAIAGFKKVDEVDKVYKVDKVGGKQ